MRDYLPKRECHFSNITKEQEIIFHIREYLSVMKDEPEGYIKLSKVYHDLRMMLGDE